MSGIIDDRRHRLRHAHPADPGQRGDTCTGSTPLTNQASTGLVADNYAGLGTGAPVSLDLQPQIANLQTWQNNVDAATGRMSVAQSALTADPVDRRLLLCAAQQRGGRERERGGHHRGIGARRAGPGGEPAGYPGRRRLRVRRPGHRQPAGARSRQHPDTPGFYTPDQCGGRPAWPSTARRRRRRRHYAASQLSDVGRHLAVLRLPVAAVRRAAGRCRSCRWARTRPRPSALPASANGLIPDSPPGATDHARRSARLHRLLHARRAAGAGDDRFAQQRAGE